MCIRDSITAAAWELSDMFHLKAIEIISRSLRGAVANTPEGRADLALGQYLSLIHISRKSHYQIHVDVVKARSPGILHGYDLSLIHI